MGAGFTTYAGARVSPPPYVDVAAYRATIARLRALRPAQMATTHFAPFAGADVDDFLAASALFVAQLDDAVRAALGREPQPLAALLPACEAAVGPFPQMGIELARSIGAHLDELERAGQAERVEPPGAAPRWALA